MNLFEHFFEKDNGSLGCDSEGVVACKLCEYKPHYNSYDTYSGVYVSGFGTVCNNCFGRMIAEVMSTIFDKLKDQDKKTQID